MLHNSRTKISLVWLLNSVKVNLLLRGQNLINAGSSKRMGFKSVTSIKSHSAQKRPMFVAHADHKCNPCVETPLS